MNKRIIISLSVIGLVAAIAIGGTIAYFNDTETSTGNIFTAGSVDLKVDHLAQVYNGMNCETCELELYSDDVNTWVVDSSDNAGVQTGFPFLAPLVSNPHQNWATHETANWIWVEPSTSDHDSGNIDVEYTFERYFHWNGVPGEIDFQMSLASDNGYAIYVNGTELIDKLGDEVNYNAIIQPLNGLESEFKDALHLGENTLTIIVRNHALPNGTPSTNPGGLLYYLSIENQDCLNDLGFQEVCRLWIEKDLEEGDTFFNFGDVKPGDWGINIISLHVYDNDAYGCLLVTDQEDNENDLIDSEIEAGDDTEGPLNGELSQFLSAVIWEDTTRNDEYDGGESILYGPAALKDIKTMERLPLSGTTTAYIGLAWCLGTQSVDEGTGIISCSGVGNQDIAQTDAFLASLTVYTEQQRNNTDFDCSEVILED